MISGNKIYNVIDLPCLEYITLHLAGDQWLLSACVGAWPQRGQAAEDMGKKG